MKDNFRHMIQLASTVLFNGYYIGFLKGEIFRGKAKVVCVPIINCYSCPGAVGSCPIGSLQAVLGDRNHQFSFYVIGFLMLFGVLMGRLICGFLCPFGFLQDLISCIKTPKLKFPASVDMPLRYLKYVILLLLVVFGPMFLTNSFGMGDPYFCKFICPVGTLEGSIPLVLSDPALKSTIGGLFFWKASILFAVILLSAFTYRPFCKYLCPLGAIYGLFNRFSFYQINLDQEKCTGCKACETICNMGVKITENKHMSECIRCGKCKSICPNGAIQSFFLGRKICVKRQKNAKSG